MDFFIRGRIPMKTATRSASVLMWMYEPLFWLACAAGC